MKELDRYLEKSINKSMIFDTDIIVDYTQAYPPSAKFFEKYVFSGRISPTASVLTVAEIFSGTRTQREENNFKKLFETVFFVYDLDYETSIKAGVIRKKHGLSLGDALIAAQALRERQPLLTRNTKHYKKVRGLKVFKPYD